jgi:MFS family permease
MLTPLLEGLLGGWASLQGATTAYLSDCTSAGRSRAQVFARFTGVFYVGFAVGPAIGAWLLRHPLINLGGKSDALKQGASNVAGVFVVAAICSALNCLLTLFIFPESLQVKVPTGPASPPAAEPTKSSAWAEFFAGFTRAGRLFAPKTRTLSNGKRIRDTSLTILGVSFFLYLLASGIFQIKYLYAQHIYGWGSEELSMYIFLAGGLRAFTLLVLVPGMGSPGGSKLPITNLFRRSYLPPEAQTDARERECWRPERAADCQGNEIRLVAG